MTAITPTAPELQPGGDWTGSPFVQVQRVLVGFIQGLHAQCPVGGYRWMPSRGDQDDVGSEVWIGKDNPINTRVVGDRPAITVLRGPGSFQGVGIGDRAFVDNRTGGEVKMDILPVTLTVNVLSRVPLEADELAWFEAKHIWALREEIMRGQEGIMYLGNRLSVSPPTPAGSLVGPDTEHNWVVCSVMIPAYLQTSMTKIPLNKRVISGFDARMTVRRPSESPESVVPLQGTAVWQPKARGHSASSDPAEIGPPPPQEGQDERQSTEPLEVRIIVDKETT